MTAGKQAARERSEGLDWVTWLGAGALLACTAILSFTTLADLAARGAYTDWRKWLWPLSVDLAGVVAVRIWLARGLATSARRTGLMLALAVIVISTAGNALEHLWQGGTLAAVMGSVPPLVLACVALLIDLSMRRPATEPTAGEHATPVTGAPAPGATPATGAPTPGEQPEPAPGARTDQDVDVEPTPPPRLHLADRLDARDLTAPATGRAPEQAEPAPSTGEHPQRASTARPVRLSVVPPLDEQTLTRAHDLIEKSTEAGRRIGRRLLASQLDITAHQARQLLEAYDNDAAPAPGAGEDTDDEETASA